MTGIVHLVGCGPGGADWVLPRARSTVRKADILFGPPELLDLFPEATAPRVPIPASPSACVPLVSAALSRGLSCAVLVRGDCGFHSLAKGLQQRLPPGTCHRVAGLSSVQVACASFGLDWDEARILSWHGREPAAPTVEQRAAPLLAVLGGGSDFPCQLERLRAELGPRRLHLASDLTLSTERLRSIGPEEPVPTDMSSRTIALLEKATP